MSARRSHSSHLPTWVATASVRRPVLLGDLVGHRLAVVELAAGDDDVGAGSAKASAIARPMPRLPPVIDGDLVGQIRSIHRDTVARRGSSTQRHAGGALLPAASGTSPISSAVFVNCTLKRSPEVSNTQGLVDISAEIMRRQGVTVTELRAVDHDIATGVWPDMTEHGWERDEWPAIFEQVMAAHILVVATPIWLGEKSSVCTHVIERLYGNSSQLNDAGQYAYYGRVGGCLVTGNEDGIKHCAMNVLYSLQHLGYVIPPQADAGWIGEAGPGSVVPRPRLGRAGERLHQPQHHVHDVEPAAPGADAHRRRRHPRPRQPALRSGTPAAASTSPTPSTADPGTARRAPRVTPDTTHEIGGSTMRRRMVLAGLAGCTAALVPAAADACGGLVGENGTIQLVRTTTLAAYNDGVERYVTAFEFTGEGESVGSIVPLPDVPTTVERGGDWTLQRLAQEVAPPAPATVTSPPRRPPPRRPTSRSCWRRRSTPSTSPCSRAAATRSAQWALENGFLLSPDAPEVLDFYADRSPVFMAAKFDAQRAAELGQGAGDSTPIMATIPTDDPWVPVRILGLGLDAEQRRRGRRVPAHRPASPSCSPAARA